MNRTRQEVAISNQALDIKVLKEILGSLRITEENILEGSNKATKITLSNEDMFKAHILAIPAKIVLEIATLKSIMERWNTNNFYFIFFHFSDFILILFYFYFYFYFR